MSPTNPKHSRRKTSPSVSSAAGAAEGTTPRGARGFASSVEPVTELGRIVQRGLWAKGLSQHAFMEEVCRRAGITFTKGQSAYVSMLLAGRRPISKAMIPHWMAALGIKRGSVEAGEFERAHLAHAACTASGGPDSPEGRAILEQMERAVYGASPSSEIQELRDRLAKLEAEAIAPPPPTPPRRPGKP